MPLHIQNRLFNVLPLLYLVHASPVAFPQAVTEAIAPSTPIPIGCVDSWSGRFGIAVIRVSISVSSSLSIHSISQPVPSMSAGGSSGLGKRDCTSAAHPTQEITIGYVSQIGDGQVQAGLQTATASVVATMVTVRPTTTTMTTSAVVIVPAVSQIGDGQIQNPPGPTATATTSKTTMTTIVTGSRVAQAVAQTFLPPTTADDDDGPPWEATTMTGSSRTTSISSSSIMQPTASRPTTHTSTTSYKHPSPPTTTSSTPPSTSSSPADDDPVLIACRTNSTLELTLSNSILHDAHNRTGYIASNYQFQFDGPPQSGALFTAGWSICPTSSHPRTNTGTSGGMGVGSPGGEGGHILALGGSRTFWQCLSGDFYNLYDRWWALQCEEVEVHVVELRDC